MWAVSDERSVDGSSVLCTGLGGAEAGELGAYE